jgi:gliding motility-associated-like protein
MRCVIYKVILTVIVFTALLPLKSQITAFPDTTVCPGDTVGLYTEYEFACELTNCYYYQVIDFAPDSIGGETVDIIDDTYIGPFDIGFEFCFFGGVYNEFWIASNGWISFEEPTVDMAVNWTPDGPIPDEAYNVPKAAIFASWRDWHSGLCFDCIHYETTGVAPNRKLIVTWDEVPLFLCTGDLGSFQIVLYETTNIIDNHLIEIPSCAEWDGGYSIQGLINADGDEAYTAPDRNWEVWETESESNRWLPGIIAWLEGTDTIGYGPTIDVLPDETTTYTAVLFGCDGTLYSDDVTVTLGEGISLSVAVTDIACGGDDNGEAQVTVTGAPGPYTYEWSNGVTDTDLITGLDSGSYSVTVTEPGGCSKTVDFIIYEPEELIAEIGEQINATCFGYNDASVTIAASGGEISYAYSLNGATPALSNIFTELVAGNYIITVTDANGCTVDVPVEITEPPLLTVSASADDSILVGQSTLITLDVSAPVVNITWEPSDFLAPCGLPEGCAELTSSPTETITYYITVTDAAGCIAYDTIHVEFIPEVFFPNAFSPNGDGFNDYFQSIAYNIASYNMKIFNRWGQMLYETTSYDGATGWDGTSEGNEQPVGTYVWQVNAIFMNGDEYNASDNFVLMR